MKPEWIYGNLEANEGEELTFFTKKSEAVKACGDNPSSVRAFLDDKGLRYNWSPPAMRGAKVLVQRCFLPMLMECEEVSAAEAVSLLQNSPSIACFVTLDDYAKGAKWQNLGFPVFEYRDDGYEAYIERLAAIGENVDSVLVELMVFETMASPIHPIAPRGSQFRSPCEYFEFVTAGFQSGLSNLVESYMRYWLRFLLWLSESERNGRGRCAVDLLLVERLGPEISMLGFLYALRELRRASS